MSLISVFDRLPNELYLLIFDYLNCIDLLYSFLNLNRRLNSLLRNYFRFPCKSLDLTQLNPRVFHFYSLQNQLNNEIHSLRLTDDQFHIIKYPLNSRLRQLNLFIESNYHIHSKEQLIFEYLQKLTIENNALTWNKPLIICHHLTEVIIHLKTHSDLLDLMSCLPVVEKLHATIDYEVTSCRDIDSSNVRCYSRNLIDFSYIIHSCHGLVYFVTDYSLIESLIQQLRHLVNLRLYIIGCLNTTIDGSRLENQLLKYLSKLKSFHLFVQSYGGNRLKTMDEYCQFQWNFGSYTNDLTDMHFLFTLPYQFQRLDECLNEYFINSIQTTFQKSHNDKLMTMNHVKHVDLSCNITLNLLTVLKQSFQSLESIRFCSSTAEYLSPPSLIVQSRYLLTSVVSVTFDHSCRNQSSFVRLLPNLRKLQINQNLLNVLLEETGSGYVCQISQLHVYSFQRHYLEDIIHAFPNLHHLILNTLLTNDQRPIRSFIDHRCHHKHRPVSITDVLDQLLKGKLSRLKQIQVGCYFERDEQHCQAILSRVIRKHRGENDQFHIKCEEFKSTRCGSVEILFF